MNHNEGPLSVEDGTQVPVRLATLAADGPTGGFFGHAGPLPW